MSDELMINKKTVRWWLLALLAALALISALVMAGGVNTAQASPSQQDTLGDFCTSYKRIGQGEDYEVWRCVARQWFRESTGFCVWIIFTVDGEPVDGFPYSENCPRGSAEHDDRVNAGHGDHIAAVYADKDDKAKPDLKLYCISPDGGYYAGQIDQALLDTVPNPPAADTLIKSFDTCSYPVELYVLATGEYQISFGPDAEGHIAVMLFKALPVDDPTFYDVHLFDS